MSSSPSSLPSITIPEGYTLHRENTTHILLPAENGAFLNPVQEFNRDLSVACIRTWTERTDHAKRAKWEQRQAKANKTAKKLKPGSDKPQPAVMDVDDSTNTTETPSAADPPQHTVPYRPSTFTILEALSATGLRSIRYAKEIPLVRYVIANDLSPTATEVMRRNVDINGLGPQPDTSTEVEPASSSSDPVPTDATTSSGNGDAYERGRRKDLALGKVRVNEGDACALMYSHRAERTRVDVLDLDPYGTAAPFIDAAIQCLSDGGLLCVTCTDLSVLANTNYPEKCFANYGGIPVKAEYSHEAALRLVLHSLSTSASRYGRYITPLLSLSIDFYVRLFVQVKSAPIEVKRAANKTATFYVCSACQSHHIQPLGKIVEKVHEPSGNKNYTFKTHHGPPVDGQGCSECGGRFQLAGPMWSGPLHDPTFVKEVLQHVEDAPAESYGTLPRMKGMLTLASEELDTPFYFTPAKVASFFHSNCPALDDIASALLHAGHPVSRSHACAGSLKTTASREDIHDIFRSWIQEHPVKMENIKPGSPAAKLLEKEPRQPANFTKHPGITAISSSSGIKLVRYQKNPLPNWGPGTKAGSGTGGKRKRNQDEDGMDPEA